MVITLPELILGGVVIVAAFVIVIWALRRQRTTALRSKFGPEYDHAVEQAGDERKAAAMLEKREKRIAKLTIKPLPAGERERFVAFWRRIQEDFVDDPGRAVSEADDLLGEVMQARGYPVSDFEQRAADISVDHPEVVQHYRVAHDITERHERGESTTEDLRQAMIHFRALFDDLVNEPDPGLVSRPAEPMRAR